MIYSIDRAMRRLTFLFVFSFIFLATGMIRAETTLWVKTPGAEVKIAKGASLPGIAKLKRGTPVEILREDGRSYRVRLPNGKIGWLYRFKLTDEKPEVDKDLSESVEGISHEQAAKGASGSAGIRGLSGISENHALRRRIRPKHIRAVKDMEIFPVLQDEIERFLKEGKLGEYGE
jgi:hypothetical protein